MIPFSKAYATGDEIKFIQEATDSGQISGNGRFTKKCQQFFENRYGVQKCFLTGSCTDALEMTALLLNIGPGDEVIIPSYTFSATANAFALRGANIVFADSCFDSPNIDPEHARQLITPRTKAIVIVHYAGIACDMHALQEIAANHGIPIIEDAAHAIDAVHNHKPLGSFGQMSTFSFHATKNIVSGEGGLLVINDQELVKRAEIIWENGTDRAAFHRGEVDKYTWVDLGSSYLPSEITAAFLWGQLQSIDRIQARRKEVWAAYQEGLRTLQEEGKCRLPAVPSYAENNGHLFYLLCKNEPQRNALIDYLRKEGIYAVFHYSALHSSPYFKAKTNASLPNSNRFAESLVRLPLFYEIRDEEVTKIISCVRDFFSR
jgi:dTDP-4-amino-4,6-dideoxygalactose transaminase